MELHEILTEVREVIRDYAGGDPDRCFYANRFIFARLQLDERKTKTQIKRELLQAGGPCHSCHKPFDEKTGICLHRLDGDRGYSPENCVLMHAECHIAFHKKKTPKRNETSRDSCFAQVPPILEKTSKRYEGRSFLYWWDIIPGFLHRIDHYEAVEFIKGDTSERCYVPTAALQGFLTKERQTSRGEGNWGIKVLKDREWELAFEPGNKRGKWLYLPVVWLSEAQED